MHDRFDTYTSPLATRNASPAMLHLWSARHKFTTWRRLWLAVAEAQQELGLNITRAQIDQIRAHVPVSDHDLELAGEFEKRLRHDVMAHVHALGHVAPLARPIIHLGMTSQDVVCNADALILRDSLGLIAAKAARVVAALGAFAEIWKAVPTLGLTHFQPAQPTTVGRRAAMWGYDIWLCLTRIERSSKALRPRGLKGATGTQASFLALLGNDAAKVEELERAFLERAGWGLHGVHTERVKSSGETPPPPSHDTTPAHVVTGQTYPRIEDAFILSDLAAMGAVLHKVATDIRLLCGRKELDEPFGDSQIGSSAMPYKRNPMRCERVCGLSRFVMNLAQNGLDTAATQWLERTLDDSSNRRLSLPEAFLALDGCLDLVHSVIGNEGEALEVHQATVRANLMAELPFMATENLMIEAVRLGRDRQEVHEAIRGHSQAAGMAVKVEGRPNDLLERLTREPLLEGVDIAAAMAPERYVGLAPLQVDRFLEQVVRPLRERYADQWRRLEATEPQV